MLRCLRSEQNEGYEIQAGIDGRAAGVAGRCAQILPGFLGARWHLVAAGREILVPMKSGGRKQSMSQALIADFKKSPA